MDQAIFFDEQDLLSDDLEFDVDATQGAVENRSKDQYGDGGFFFDPDGVVTANIANPGTKIDITTGTVIYDSRGRRSSFPQQIGIPLINIVGGNNFVLVSIPNFDDTPVQNPVSGDNFNTRKHDSFNIEIKPTFTQGDVDGAGNPFIPIAKVTSNGAVETITDLRVFPAHLQPNTVGTAQLIDNSVTESKLADYLKPIIWATPPDLYWDRESQQIIARRQGNFNLPDVVGNIAVTGFPLPILQPTVTTVVIGTIVANICTASTVVIQDLTSLPKSNVIVFGYVDIDGTFREFQAPENDELLWLAEEEFNGSGLRKKPHENMWRRRNESFQSFTPNTIDGVPVAIPNPMNLLSIIGGPNLQVALGQSFVAGRRLNQQIATTLTALNTKNYAIMTGTNTFFDVYILRDFDTTGGNKFRYEALASGSAAPSNGYLIGTVMMVANAFSTLVDKRVFTPVKEAVSIIGSAQVVRAGARLRNTTAPADIGVKIVVEPGIIGFADGSVRINQVQKILDFTQTFDPAIATASKLTGALQTQQGGSPTALEPFSHYAIFATADHAGSDFNIVAVKIPFFRNVTGAAGPPGFYQYTLTTPGNFPANREFYVGQKIRATRTDYTGPQYLTVNQNPAQTEFTQDSAIAPEVITSVIGNVITTSLGSNVALTGFTGGTLTAKNKFRPDPVLTGITNRYRLLGLVSTEGTSAPNTLLRKFIAEGDNVVLEMNGNVNLPGGKIANAGATSQGWNLDVANFAPVCVKDVKFIVSFVVGFYSIQPVGSFHLATYYDTPVTVVVGPGDNLTVATQLGIIQGPIGGGGFIDGTITMAIPTVHNGGSFSGESQPYMGFLQMGVGSGPSLGFASSSFLITGYRYDVKNEWALQFSAAGVGGFVP